MDDVVFIAIGAAFFVVAGLYLFACERL